MAHRASLFIGLIGCPAAPIQRAEIHGKYTTFAHAQLAGFDATGFSALLVFKMDSPTNPHIRKTLESIIIFQAKDFNEAHAKAVEIGTQRAENESVRNGMGEIEIRLTLCSVETLDMVQKILHGFEVWSRLTDVNEFPEVCLTKPPVQTI